MAIKHFPVHFEFGFFERGPGPVGRVATTTTPQDLVSLIECVTDEATGKEKAKFTQHVSLTITPYNECSTPFSDGPDRYFSFFRVKISYDTNSALNEQVAVAEGDTAVATRFPWTYRSLAEAPFKTHLKNSIDFFDTVATSVNRYQKSNGLKDLAPELLEGIFKRFCIENALKKPYDPWESRSNYLSAAIYRYELYKLGELRAYKERKLEEGFEPSVLLGVVRGHDRVVNNLRRSEKLRALYEKALSNELYPRAGEEFANVASDCLELSIKQALSGAYHHENWIEKYPNVEDLVEFIFKEHAERFRKQTSYHKQKAKVDPDARETAMDEGVRAEVESFGYDDPREDQLKSILGQWLLDLSDRGLSSDLKLDEFFEWLSGKLTPDMQAKLILKPDHLFALLDDLLNQWQQDTEAH